MATSYGMEGPAFESRQGQDISLIQNIETGSDVHSQWVRLPESGVVHTLPSSAKAINVCSHTSTPPVCFQGVEMDNLKFLSVKCVLEFASVITALSCLAPTAQSAVQLKYQGAFLLRKFLKSLSELDS
jgi:hypothetical protein